MKYSPFLGKYSDRDYTYGDIYVKYFLLLLGFVVEAIQMKFRKMRILSRRDNHQIVTASLSALFIGLVTLAVSSIWRYESRHQGTQPFHFGDAILNFFQNPFTVKEEGQIEQFCQWWRRLPEGEQIFWPILVVCVLVYIAWQIPALASTMVKWFCNSSGVSKKQPITLPMVLSVFSHSSWVHLATNLGCLHALSPIAATTLGREMYLALLITSGAVSFVGSIWYMAFNRRKYLSLGLSGGLMGISALIYQKIPTLQVQLFLIPGLVFPASTAVGCLLCFDLVCLFYDKVYFDHAAHVTGFIFGLALHNFGEVPIKYYCRSVVLAWEFLRSWFSWFA